MATAEELLAQMEENPELYSDSVGPVNDVIVINAETRTIELPESEKIFGVESDKASERKYFKCPKIVGDNIDLSTLNLFINFKNANNEADIYRIDDVEVDGDYITFSWLLSKKVTAYKTDASKNQLLSFIFCAKMGEGPENEWNTTICSDGIVLEGLEPGESIAEDNPDIIQYILERLDSAGTITPEQISGAVEEYFASNPLEETDPTVPSWAKEEAPDKTLSEEGKAADAKATGDAISQLSEEIANLKKNTPSSGSVLTVAQVEALDGMFKKCAFTSDVTAEYEVFKQAFGLDGTDTPVDPSVTLSTISATYTGGDVTVGTELTALTGITVTAHYSDGSTANITGYTLSGTIAEGSNTITVSYDGKTTTFTVIGVAESGGDVEATTLRGLQLEAFPAANSDTDIWDYSNYGSDLSNAYGGGNQTKFAYKLKLFTGTVYVRSLKKSGTTIGRIPEMWVTGNEDFFNNVASETLEQLTAEKSVSSFAVDGTTGFVSVLVDGTIERPTNGYVYPEGADAGYVWLEKFVIPEGKYGVLTLPNVCNDTNAGVRYREGWSTVFYDDPTNNITCTEVAD